MTPYTTDMSVPPGPAPPMPRQALSELWTAATQSYRDQTGSELVISGFGQDLLACDNADAVSSVIDARTKEFKAYRKYGGKTKETLKRAVPILRKFADATADAIFVSQSLSQLVFFLGVLIFRSPTGDTGEQIRCWCDHGPSRGKSCLDLHFNI